LDVDTIFGDLRRECLHQRVVRNTIFRKALPSVVSGYGKQSINLNRPVFVLDILKITKNSEKILNITENSEQILNITEYSEQILNIAENFQLPVQSVPITTKVVSLNPAHGEVYSIQYYVIKFVSDFLQVSGYLRFLHQ
jgi:hypothetical protein